MTATRTHSYRTKTYRFAWVIVLAGIIGLAFLVRIWHINTESFWADEGWTMLLSKGPTLSDVVQTMAGDQHPPLYFVLMHYWIDLAGNSEFTTRFLSLMWSVVGVALLYRLGADCFSPGAGAIGALMLALADNDTYLAQDARHYTEMAALATCSTLFYLRYLRRPTRTNGILWLLSSVALIYTHYLGAFILLVQLIHLLIFARPKGRLGDMLIRWAAIGVAWLPWAFVFVNQSLVRYTRPILYQSTWADTPETFAIVRTDLLGTHFGLTAGLLLLGLVYVSYRTGIPRVRWRPVRTTLYMLLWLAVPVITIVVINPVYPILTSRNFLLVTPVIWLLVGHGIMNLDRTARVFVLVVLVLVSLFTVSAYFVKPPWRQVALDILNYRATNEPVIMDVWTDDFALRYHIGRDLGVDPATLPLVSVPQWQEAYRAQFYPMLQNYLKDKNSVWLAHWRPDDDIPNWLATHGFTLTATQTETHLQTNIIYIYRYDRVTNDPPLATFGGSLALLNANVEQQTTKSGAPELQVQLLWKALQKPKVDYSVSVIALDASGRSVGNVDSPPLDGKVDTSTLKAGDVQYDDKTLDLPATLPAGVYSVAVKIYWYVDQKPLPVTTQGQNQPSGEFYVIQPVAVG